jgi:hypothetical protein
MDSHARIREAKGERTRARRRSVGEDILVRPAAQIQAGAHRHELETRLGEVLSHFPVEHLVEARFDLMQIGNIESGILLL